MVDEWTVATVDRSLPAWNVRAGRQPVRETSVSVTVSVAESVDVEYNDDDDDCSESSSVVTLQMAKVPDVASTRPLAARTSGRCPNELRA